MRSLQKLGGIAALVAAATFIVGFAVFLALLESEGYGAADTTAEENAAFLADNQTVMYAWNFIIYVVFGIALVVLSLALYERLKTATPALVQVAAAFGLIWSGLVIASGMVANIGASAVVDLYETDPVQAGTLWQSLDFVVNGIGGGNEIVGGIWMLLISWASLQAMAFSRSLNYLGVVAGASGIITAIPVLEPIGAVFGLGSIVWFIWVGVVMLRASPNTAHAQGVGTTPSLASTPGH